MASDDSISTQPRRKASPSKGMSPAARKAFWMRQLHQWHWISSAMSLAGMLLFAVTGVTLNHAADIEGSPRVETRETQLPGDVLAALTEGMAGQGASVKAPLPAVVAGWLDDSLGARTGRRDAEWSANDVYLSLPRAGGDAWLSIDRSNGKVTYERTDRGWISYFNDLHKGRNAGAVWFWFIDLFALACLVFCGTGLVILKLHAVNRPSTWPLAGLGLVAPIVLMIFFVHR
ncbi:MAG: PepSY-associated TM helix domain-containing protein [Alphaproteobacteria bacterium]